MYLAFCTRIYCRKENSDLRNHLGKKETLETFYKKRILLRDLPSNSDQVSTERPAISPLELSITDLKKKNAVVKLQWKFSR